MLLPVAITVKGIFEMELNPLFRESLAHTLDKISW